MESNIYKKFTIYFLANYVKMPLKVVRDVHLENTSIINKIIYKSKPSCVLLLNVTSVKIVKICTFLITGNDIMKRN